MWDFQNTKFKLADIKAQAVAVRTDGGSTTSPSTRPPPDAGRGRHRQALTPRKPCGKALDEWCNCTGGYGYMLEYPVARAFADSRVTRIYGGTSEVMRDLISRKDVIRIVIVKTPPQSEGRMT
ncbi:acyl-CoA dehydrogenase family protein [Cupriavidus basilensis]